MPFDQRKCTICWPNLVDRCTLTSDASSFSRPLDRLQKRVLKDRAITPDTSFSITATLDTSRPVGVVALFSHNLTVDAQWRVRLYDDADAELEDSGWQDVWPPLFQSWELAWEQDNYWTGRPSDEDRERFTTQTSWFADKAWYGKKAVIDIADDTNPDGYIEVGRLFLGDVFQPGHNMSYGVQWVHDDPSGIDQALDGTEYFDERPQVRECSIALDWLDEAEAFARMFRLQRDTGITGEVFFAQQLMPNSTFFQRTMLCRAANADPVVHPDAARHAHAKSFREIL